MKPDEFTAIVESRTPRWHATAYLLTRDWGLAEDLLQATLTKVWLAWARIDVDVDGYVYRTMIHTYRTWWRRKWRAEVATSDLPDSVDRPDLTSSRTSEIDLWRAMARLPRRQRAVIVLRYFVDLTESETANAMGCSIGTVKSQTSKALAKLRVDPSVSPEMSSERSQP